MTPAGTRAGAVATLMLGCLLGLASPAPAAREFARVGAIGGFIQDWNVDARGRGLAGAEVAMPPGAAAAFWNPGALSQLETEAVAQVSLTRPLRSLELKNFSAAARYRGVAFGAHLGWLSYDNRVRSVFRPEGEGRSFKSSDKLAILAIGVDLADRLWPTRDARSRPLDWGMGLAYRLVQSEFVEEDDTAGDLELGTLLTYRIPARDGSVSRIAPLRLQAGYTIRNLTNNHLSYSYGNWKLGRRDRGGVAAIASAGPRIGAAPLARGTVSYERQMLLIAAFEDEKPADRLGLELCAAGLATVRLGYVWDWRYPPHRDRRTWGFGLGLDPGNPYTSRFGGRLDFSREETEAASEVLDCTLSMWARL